MSANRVGRPTTASGDVVDPLAILGHEVQRSGYPVVLGRSAADRVLVCLHKFARPFLAQNFDEQIGLRSIFRKPPPRAVWLLSCEIVYRVSLWTHTKTPPAFKDSVPRNGVTLFFGHGLATVAGRRLSPGP